MTFSSIHMLTGRVLSIILILTLPFIAFSQSDIPAEKQKNSYIKSVFFGGGSYQIDAEQKQEVIDFILDIEDLREYEITLHGHTDNIGSREFNQWLSEMRSGEVLDILGELFLDKIGIEVHDFGEESPYYDNRSWKGKLSNRRVDVIIQKIIM